ADNGEHLARVERKAYVTYRLDFADMGIEGDAEILDREDARHQCRSFGSVASRRPSPINCNDSMVRLMTSEGNMSMYGLSRISLMPPATSLPTRSAAAGFQDRCS